MSYGKNGLRATMRRAIRASRRTDGKRGLTKPPIKKNRAAKKAQRRARRAQRHARV